MTLAIDSEAAVARLLKFLAVEGVTGQEAAIAATVTEALVEGGVPRDAIRYDEAHKKIPLPTQTGNLIVTLPGTLPGPRRLFMTHLDTVPLCAGAVPVHRGERIVAQGETALGGDNRTGVGVLVTMITTLLQHKLPHPPLTLLFTVREESGLWGARFVDPADLGHPVEAFNVDGRNASDLIIGAVGAERWEVEIFGKASHAGVHPEQGVSATAVAALAIADVVAGGWFGKVIREGGKTGTSNIGSFGGKDGRSAGNATNVVTDYVHIKGEARSHDSDFVRAIVTEYREAFEDAGSSVRDHQGQGAKVQFVSQLDYSPFRVPDDAPVVKHAQAAAALAGLTPLVRTSNGGLDANWMVKHGIPTVTIGAGQNAIHSVGEYVELSEYVNGCRMALALATLPGEK